MKKLFILLIILFLNIPNILNADYFSLYHSTKGSVIDRLEDKNDNRCMSSRMTPQQRQNAKEAFSILFIFLGTLLMGSIGVLIFMTIKNIIDKNNNMADGIFCTKCKYAHAVYWYWKEGSNFDYYECWHPKEKKYVKRINYSTGEDHSYVSAPRGENKNKNGNCKDFELYVFFWKFWK